MIVAVTGGSGFLGRRVVALLRYGGHDVRLLARRSDGGGLSDRAALRQLCAGADRLVHMASHGVQARDRAMSEMIAANVSGTVDVLAAAIESGVPGTVVTGTVLEYAGGDLPLREDAATNAADPYGATKSAAGLLARTMAESAGHPLVYLRLASMLGRDDDPDKLVPRVMRALASRAPVDLTPGAQEREWLHVEDGAEAVVAALGLATSVTLNIGTGVGFSVRHVLERLCEAMAADPKLLRFGGKAPRAGEPSRLVMDVDAAKRVLGWKSTRTIDDIVAELASSVKG